MPKRKTGKNTVLLVEDDATLSDAFKILLESEGFKVIPSFNGEEALEQLTHTDVDLILLDLLMPVMDGKEFLQHYENADNVPVIVFSNLDTKTDINEVLDLGASRYILKSWATPEELTKVIKDEIKSIRAK